MRVVLHVVVVAVVRYHQSQPPRRDKGGRQAGKQAILYSPRVPKLEDHSWERRV